MAMFKILISRHAQKQLDKFPDTIAEPLINAILSLSENPRPQGYKKLKGRDAYRIRKGDYRIIYEIADEIVTVEIIAVGHRKDIYDQ
jgi:mRNA interferase RelE/StbE